LNIFRIEAEWVEGLSAGFGQTLELVAGFTPRSYIAEGNWFGAVKDGQTIYPFVLTDNGHCRYSGDHSMTRYFSIVKRPVKVGEIFELTWNDHNDKHCYRITKLVRLNLQQDWPDEEPQHGSQVSPIDDPREAEPKKAPGIFIRNELVRDAQQPEALKATVGALIETGNVLAVGENSIERVFADVTSFRDWVDEIRSADDE
jgi:hypothetical protein